MKKNIALLLAAIMTVSSLPMTAMASTTNTVSKIPTVEDGTTFDTSIFIDEFKGIVSGEEHQTIKLTLTNAEFTSTQFGGSEDVKSTNSPKAVYKECPAGDVTTIYKAVTEFDGMTAYNSEDQNISTVLEGGNKEIAYYLDADGTKYSKDK